MDNQEQKQTFLKRLIVITPINLVLLIGLIVFLFIQNLIGINLTNSAVTYCNTFLTFKYSGSLKQMLTSQFLMAILAVLLCLVNMVFFILYFLNIRKKQGESSASQNQQNKMKPTLTKLRLHFALTFLQMLFTFTIIIRNIQALTDNINCFSTLSLTYLILTGVALINLVILIIRCCFLMKILKIYQEQQKTNDQENDQRKVLNSFQQRDKKQRQQNKFKNTLENEMIDTRRPLNKQNDLREQLIKDSPSGYRSNKNDSLKNGQRFNTNQNKGMAVTPNQKQRENIYSKDPQENRNLKRNYDPYDQNDSNDNNFILQGSITPYNLEYTQGAIELDNREFDDQALVNISKISMTPKVLDVRLVNDKIEDINELNRPKDRNKKKGQKDKKMSRLEKQLQKKKKQKLKKNQKYYPNDQQEESPSYSPKNERIQESPKYLQNNQSQNQSQFTEISPNGQMKKISLLNKTPKNHNIKPKQKFQPKSQFQPNPMQYQEQSQEQSEVEQQLDPNQLYSNKKVAEKPNRNYKKHQKSLKKAYKQIQQKKQEEDQLYKDEQRYLDYESFLEHDRPLPKERPEMYDNLDSSGQGPLLKRKLGPTKIYLHLQKKEEKLPENRRRLFDDDQLQNDFSESIQEPQQEQHVIIGKVGDQDENQNLNPNENPHDNEHPNDNNNDENLKNQNDNVIKIQEQEAPSPFALSRRKKKKHQQQKQEQIRRKPLTKQQKMLQFIRDKYISPSKSNKLMQNDGEEYIEDQQY